MVKDIVVKNGNKISIDILDDEPTLELFYKSHYGSNQLGRILTQNESDQVAVHLIASYSGELENMVYLNQLDFFPGAFKDTPVVGEYVEFLEFDARN